MSASSDLRELNDDAFSREYDKQIETQAGEEVLQKYRDESNRREAARKEAGKLAAKQERDRAARELRQAFDAQQKALKKLQKSRSSIAELGSEGDQLAPAIKKTFNTALAALADNAALAKVIKPTLDGYDPHGANANLADALMNQIALLGLAVRFGGDKDKAGVGATVRGIADTIVAEAEIQFKKNWPNGAPPPVPGVS